MHFCRCYRVENFQVCIGGKYEVASKASSIIQFLNKLGVVPESRRSDRDNYIRVIDANTWRSK